MSTITRREFFEDSILATAAIAAGSISTKVLGAETAALSANDKITVAIIGCGIRGKQHASELARLPECEIAWVCDPDSTRAAEVASDLAAKNRPSPKTTQDLRKVFEDKSVSAVFIAAPNHWHALAAIWAMQAGKDVYVEKPVSHEIAEGRRIVQAARKLNRICQGGTQNRSNRALAGAIQYIHDGKLGDVKLARSIVYGARGSIGGPAQCEIPKSVDLDLWTGPARMLPLTRPKFHYDWHWFWNTGNGELGNNNIHSIDICRWGLGVTGLGRSVMSYGGRFGYEDSAETPNTQVVVYDFGEKTIVTETRGLKTEAFNPAYTGGWIFFGTEGIIAGTSLFDLDGRLIRTFEGPTESHFGNFLKAVRSRKISDLNADILEGHQSTALCHLGNISYRLGHPSSPDGILKHLEQLKTHDNVAETFDRTRAHLLKNDVDLTQRKMTVGPILRMDSEKERFIDDPRADALLAREDRKPFVVPSEGDV